MITNYVYYWYLLQLMSLTTVSLLNQTNSGQSQSLSLDHFAVNLADMYANNHRWLVGFLSKKLSCPHSAADIAQDTFVRLLSKTDHVQITEPRAYLTTIANGLMVNHFKRRAIESAYLEALAHIPETATLSPEALSIAIETLVNIDNMLDGLPEKVRMAFLLCQLEGLSHAEIASQLSVSVSSVRKYITRALLHCVATR